MGPKLMILTRYTSYINIIIIIIRHLIDSR